MKVKTARHVARSTPLSFPFPLATQSTRSEIMKRKNRSKKIIMGGKSKKNF